MRRGRFRSVGLLTRIEHAPYGGFVGTADRRTQRALALVALVAIAGVDAAACGQATPPIMAGVNHTDREAYVRLVIRGGGFGDFLLPPNSAVLLSTNLEVDRAVTFDASCNEVGTSVFGDPQIPFSVGGQIYIGPRNESGMTTDQLAPPPALPASPTNACANVPTPADPRLRVPIDAGGVRASP
jgi:hypothetical protein